MPTILKTKNSVTTTVVPTSLQQGELAVNITDKKLWVGNAATTPVQLLGAGVTGDVVGPASATDNAVARFDATTGKLIQNSLVTVSDTGAISAPVDASISGLTVGKGGGAVATNTALGVDALKVNEAGGTNNTAIGYQAADSNTTGDNNVAVGSQTLQANTTASGNTAVGYQAGFANTTGRITALGAKALYANTTGFANVALGGEVAGTGGAPLAANTTGNYNIAVGTSTLSSNTTAEANTAVGHGSMAANTTGANNVALGFQALLSNTTANNNTAVGYQAGYTNVTGAGNAFFGTQAGYLSTGSYNAFLGAYAGYNSTGSGNTFVGINSTTGNGAGYNMTTGSDNTILGGYNGNQNSLDIRTASNYIVLSDGDGSPKLVATPDGRVCLNCISEPNNTVNGFGTSNEYTIMSASAGTVLYVNRNTNDGDIVAFRQDNNTEGTISVSGNTISYNAFAGSHWSQLSDGSKPNILRGTVLESINELVEWPNEPTSERLCRVKISDTTGSKKIYGVFMDWDNDWVATNDMLVTAVGAFVCRINKDVVVQEGDLLESNGDGTARVQVDDIIRSSTIGKVTCTEKTHQFDDGSYCVPTVLYCG
jgi:hypothetical protein